MLKRLVILNSEIYAKADIDLNDCNNLQIVGPNNIGKSTLIYALNFLYIIDGRQMTFSGNRTGDKTTINHYFPTIHSSYIVFEIFKKRYYCILVKKSADGTLDFYKIDSDFREEHYFVPVSKGSKLNKFDDVQTQWSTTGVNYAKFQDRRELFNFVYQKGKRNQGVVWLNEGMAIDQREISNNFSKIYKYLINSRLIDNRTLKESLIVADSKGNERVEFTKKNQKDIQNLLKHNREIKVIRGIEEEFSQFKDLVDQYRGRTQLLSETIGAFNQRFSTEFNELGTDSVVKKKEKDNLKVKLRSELEPRQNSLHQTIGGLRKDILQHQTKLENLELQIQRIKSYPPIEFLQESFNNLDRQRRDIESRLTQIENQNIKSREVEENITRCQQDIARLDRQIDTYTNLLIHQISDSNTDKELLNAILSDAITSLSKDHIKEKIGQVGEWMTLFDGVLRLPDDMQRKPIPSVNDLKERRSKAHKEKLNNEELLPIAKDRENYQKELSEIQAKIKEVTRQEDEIKSLQELEMNLSGINDERKQLISKKDETEKELRIVVESIDGVKGQVETLSEDITTIEKRIEKIRDWKAGIEAVDIEPVESTIDVSLDTLFRTFELNVREKEEIKTRKDRLFDKLKNQVESVLASEDEFIDYIESEMATLDDKRRSIDGLLKNISTQFSNPCKTLYSKFQEFEGFINNRFNSKIRKIRISDIDSLQIEIIPNDHLIGNLKKIMAIRDLTFELLFEDQTENLEILNKYLDRQEVIEFENLFDIQLHLDKNDVHKVVNLKNQIESDGTDKMIRLVIIMSIISQIAINDVENKIVIFIDEIGTIDEANRLEILEFCRENHFVPISAAPLHPYDGFDKYYLIRRSKGKINLSDHHSIVIRRKLRTT